MGVALAVANQSVATLDQMTTEPEEQEVDASPGEAVILPLLPQLQVLDVGGTWGTYRSSAGTNHTVWKLKSLSADSQSTRRTALILTDTPEQVRVGGAEICSVCCDRRCCFRWPQNWGKTWKRGHASKCSWRHFSRHPLIFHLTDSTDRRVSFYTPCKVLIVQQAPQ